MGTVMSRILMLASPDNRVMGMIMFPLLRLSSSDRGSDGDNYISSSDARFIRQWATGGDWDDYVSSPDAHFIRPWGQGK